MMPNRPVRRKDAWTLFIIGMVGLTILIVTLNGIQTGRTQTTNFLLNCESAKYNQDVAILLNLLGEHMEAQDRALGIDEVVPPLEITIPEVPPECVGI